jgi:hypothetical protein
LNAFLFKTGIAGADVRTIVAATTATTHVDVRTSATLAATTATTLVDVRTSANVTAMISAVVRKMTKTGSAIYGAGAIGARTASTAVMASMALMASTAGLTFNEKNSYRMSYQ